LNKDNEMTAYPETLSIRKQAEISMTFLRKRLQTILPTAMREGGIDMWLVLCQEDNPDPVFNTLIPLNTWTPILQMMVFYDRDAEKGVEMINLSMTNTYDLYDRPWRGVRFEEQWVELVKIIQERDPRAIGVNTGSVNWSAGGLTHNLYQQLTNALPEKYVKRLCSAEITSTRWLMTLSEEELDFFPHLVSLTHHIIADCFSRVHIIPGVTTTDDLEWAFWQKSSDLGLGISFKPFFNLVRSQAEQACHPVDDRVIRPGDMVHCDVGNRYLGLCSDLQEWVYIRRAGEEDVPAGLKKLWLETARLQKIFMSEFKEGLTGDELLKNILNRARAEEIPGPRIYSHSLGHFLHEPGPLIGLPWEQERNPGRGDVRLVENSCFTMELAVEDTVPEWGGQNVRFSVEQDVAFTSKGCHAMDGVQTEFHLI
jgi:Xaa-Pro aminopeptidase